MLPQARNIVAAMFLCGLVSHKRVSADLLFELRLVSIADRKARKLRNRLASAMRIDGWDSLCEVRGGSAIFAVKSHMFNFCEHPRNSWGCCEVWKQKTQVRNAPLFWRYSFGLTLLCER